MDKREIIIKVFPFFEKELIDEISEVSVMRSITEGQSIMDEGDYIKAFPLVVSGCLRVVRLAEDGKELLLYFLHQGEICSMALTCCMGMQKSVIRMTAEEDSVILTVPVDKPERWMSEYRTWKEFMMYSVRKRFDELLYTIDSIAFTKLDERLVRFFRERYRATGKTQFNGTHLDLAYMLNSSREVITRLLRNLEKKGLVITERNIIDYTKLVRN